MDILFDALSDKRDLMLYANSEGSDHPTQPCSLIRIFYIRPYMHWFSKCATKALIRLCKSVGLSGPSSPE